MTDLQSKVEEIDQILLRDAINWTYGDLCAIRDSWPALLEALEEAAKIADTYLSADYPECASDIAFDIRALAQGGKPSPVAGTEGGK